jgi:hypothetical protein
MTKNESIIIQSLTKIVKEFKDSGNLQSNRDLFYIRSIAKAFKDYAPSVTIVQNNSHHSAKDIVSWVACFYQWIDDGIKLDSFSDRIHWLGQFDDTNLADSITRIQVQLELDRNAKLRYGTINNANEGKKKIVIIFMGSDICQRYTEILKQIKSITPTFISYRLLLDNEISITEFPNYAQSSFVIFNWNKYAVLFRTFLQDHDEFNTQMVLYSHIYPSSVYNLTKIKQYGLFNFVILPNDKRAIENWKDVLNAIANDASNYLSIYKPVEYISYRWHWTDIQDYFGVHKKNRLSGKDFSEGWEEIMPKYKDKSAGNRLVNMFSSLWKNELKQNQQTMDIKPIWGRPKYDHLNEICFILMPFREPFETIYKDHLTPVVKEFGLTPMRADNYFSTHAVMQDIWEGINNARLIIAELTDRNPNVLYELGVAHTLGKEVIMLTQNVDDIPFDLRHLRFYTYEYTPRGCAKLMENVKLAMATIKEESSPWDNVDKI